MSPPSRHARGALVALLFALIPAVSCGEKKPQKAATAPKKGVVGKVLSVRGAVTYSVGGAAERKPLTAGMELRAEWTVHTGPEAELMARLSNGHRWTLAGDLSKRVSRIRALTLAPVKEGAVAQLSDLGGSAGKDRSAAAGLHQERTAGAKAAPTRSPGPTSMAALDEAPAAARPAPAARPRRKARARRSSSRAAGRRAARRPPKRRAALEGLFGGGRGMGAALSGMLRPRARPRGERESLPVRLTRAQLDKVLAPRRAHLTGCLKTHKVKKALAVRLVIRGRDGRVTAVRVPGRASADKVVRCLLTRARALRFARFSAATQTTHAIRLSP